MLLSYTEPGTAAALFLAVLMFVAGLRKLRHPALYRQHIASYRVVPPALLGAVSLPLGMLECVTGVALLLPSLREYSAIAVATLLTLYTAVMSIALLRGGAGIDCGCGPFWLRQPLSAWHILRNLLLLPCLALVTAAGTSIPEGSVAWGRTALIAITAVAVYGYGEFLLARDALLADD